MPNVFTPRTNLIARVSIVVLLCGGAALTTGAYVYARSAYVTGVGVQVEQPIPFSHQHHVAGLGIDCRYCHQGVETDAFAGMPATQTCMNCHSKLWTDAPLLEPLRQSWKDDAPVPWRRVHDLPDFVFFNHSIHIHKGIGCSTCHGRVDQMRLMRKSEPLFMHWCVSCHRDPKPNLRPSAELFSMTSTPSRDPQEQEKLYAQYGIVRDGLTNCSTCHR